MNRKQNRLLAAVLWVSVLAFTPVSRARAANLLPPLPFGTDGLDIPPAITLLQISPRTIQLLGASLLEGDETTRAFHARELAACGPPALAVLLPALKDAVPVVRAEVVRSIGLVGDTAAFAQIAQFLNDPDPRVRREAVFAAAKLNHAEAVTPALDDSDQLVQRAAIASAAISDQADKIARAFANLPAPIKPIVLDALGRMKSAEHADVAVAGLKMSLPIRIAAVRALGEMRATSANDAVVALLGDSSPAVRREATLALRGTASVEVQQSHAIAMLDDPDPTVRQGAAIVLQSAPTPAAISGLCKLLPDPYEPVHMNARAALVAIGQPAVPAAAAMLDDSNPRRREDGSFLLGAFASDRALDRHIQLLDDPDWDVVTQAGTSLRRLKTDPDVVGPHLLAMIDRAKKGPLNQSAVFAQQQAFLLAGQLHFATIIPIAIQQIPRSLTNPGAPDEMRTAAIWAIGVISKPGDPALHDVRGVMGNPLQTNAAVFEALKALVNAHDTSATNLMDHWVPGGDEMRDNTCRWMAHYGADLFSGTITPYTPKQLTRTVNLSIEDAP